MSVFFNIVLSSDFLRSPSPGLRRSKPFGRAASKGVSCLMRLRRKPRKKSKNFGACQVASYKSSLNRKSSDGCAVAKAQKASRFRVSFRSARASSRRFGKWRVDLKPASGGVDASHSKALRAKHAEPICYVGSRFTNHDSRITNYQSRTPNHP